MAESILKLKVSSEEYDNKLKQATNGLTRYVDECRKVGGTLEYVEKETLDYVRALGQMDTTSRTATGKLSEMKKTFVELSAQYKQMTDAEKASPFGKALAQSLDQLKGRIGESKVQLDDINKSINSSGGLSGALDAVAGKFGLSIEQVTKFGGIVGVATTAINVAKDAFFASEATVDEWGRVVDSSKSLYEGFLTALNTGDISGYLGRIDEIVTAARRAYDELDRLGTMKTIQAPKMSAQQTENERMRMMIQTGRYIAPVDGRRASMKDGQLLTPDQIRRIEAQLQNGMKTVVSLVGNEVKQTGKAIDAVYNRQAQELGMSLKEFRKGTSSMAEFDKRMAGYDQYQKWREQHTTIDMQSGREIVARGNPFEQFAKWGTFRVDGQRYNDLVKLIQQRDQQAGQAYSMQSQAYRTMNRAEGVTVSKLMRGETSGGGATGGGRGSVTHLSIEDILRSSLLKADRGFDADSLRDTSTGPSRLWEMMQQNHYANLKPDLMSRADFEAGQNRAKNEIESREGGKDSPLESGKKMLNGISQLTDGLEKMGIEMPDEIQSVIGVIQGVMQVIEAVNTIIGVTQTSALAANTAAMISLEAALWANTTTSWLPWANGGVVHAAGGIVAGNTYSGDQIPSMLNAGEVVLNRAQAGNLASQLQGSGGQMQLETTITGEQIRLVLNNNGRRTGRGEYVTSNRR